MDLVKFRLEVGIILAEFHDGDSGRHMLAKLWAGLAADEAVVCGTWWVADLPV